ncbi:multicopper oxidase family protein [Flavihumibacter petaseus]|uniref:Multicopper oxidase n=1 Tax=Flavihumibacter petaseus NBRC 106054 TaxID=1220578 RepID=A0A0E9N2G0_9BACT|nr:multicopper oxidase domain-containing protein [Flavihumibacter petaseus]GAO43973.1 multicopper oxidase [Flavihumibacter petaseus NBRC 106054]
MKRSSILATPMASLLLLLTAIFPVRPLQAQHAQPQHSPAASATPHREPFRTVSGGRIIYHLYITDTVVNYTGKKAKAIAINGTIPAPELRFTEGDTAELHVHNLMHMETSIHWHGLILPNEQDGVPYLTTTPIKAHSTLVYSFPIVQNGTYWYHSHSMLQEQSGMYGAFIIDKRNSERKNEHTVLLSDWTNEKPEQIERSLHSATDWYAIRKNAAQDYWQAGREKKLGVKFNNEWKRMLAMDVSDVYYDQFTVNGKPEETAPLYKAGDKVRLRVINGSSSTYFWLRWAGGKITVVASDGQDVEPVEVDRLIVGVSETYDVVVTIPASGSYEFMATAEDRTKSTSLWLGEGSRHPAGALPRLKYFEGMKMMNDMMNMDGTMNDMGMSMSLQQMDMNTVMYPELVDSNQEITALNYSLLRAPASTKLPDGPVREMLFELTGNMNRYVWTINNKTVSESDKVLIKKGENIRIIIRNNSMMRHPMHLHGHFFRVLNGQGDNAPLKSVLDVMPMETDTIEFHASEQYGDWFFHCHILYHMMAGMGRIFSYDTTGVAVTPGKQQDQQMLPYSAHNSQQGFQQNIRKVYRDDRRLFLSAQIGLESNGSDGEIRLANTRWSFDTEWRLGINKEKGYESETHIGRYIGRNQWLMPYIGYDWRSREYGHHGKAEDDKNLFGQTNTKDERSVICFGVQYVLPLLIRADARVDTEGKLRFQLGREDVAVTKRLRFNFYVNTDKEYMTGLRYIVTKYFSLSTHYDSDMGWGGGVTVTY